jgi:hypothetical protein
MDDRRRPCLPLLSQIAWSTQADARRHSVDAPWHVYQLWSYNVQTQTNASAVVEAVVDEVVRGVAREMLSAAWTMVAPTLTVVDCAPVDDTCR